MATPKQGFQIVRKGPQANRSVENRPPDEMLSDPNCPPGTIVVGSDGTQWIHMPPLPARWERSKKPIGKKSEPPASS